MTFSLRPMFASFATKEVSLKPIDYYCNRV